MPITRRAMMALTARGCAIAAAGACGLGAGQSRTRGANGRLEGRLAVAGRTTASGVTALGLGTGRDGWLRMPSAGPLADEPLPLLVLLHGAGGSGEQVTKKFAAAADAAGVVLLAPDSRGTTWDGIRGSFGPDVDFLDQALIKTGQMVAIDAARLAIGGFSDGATYGLSLGLINGDLFPRIAAFSPGFVVEAAPHGAPAIFIAHGTKDEILPIDRCSRVIVPRLQRAGYRVTYREFDGPHDVPPAIASAGLEWIAAR